MFRENHYKFDTYTVIAHCLNFFNFITLWVLHVYNLKFTYYIGVIPPRFDSTHILAAKTCKFGYTIFHQLYYVGRHITNEGLKSKYYVINYFVISYFFFIINTFVKIKYLCIPGQFIKCI